MEIVMINIFQCVVNNRCRENTKIIKLIKITLNFDELSHHVLAYLIDYDNLLFLNYCTPASLKARLISFCSNSRESMPLISTYQKYLTYTNTTLNINQLW